MVSASSGAQDTSVGQLYLLSDVEQLGDPGGGLEVGGDKQDMDRAGLILIWDSPDCSMWLQWERERPLDAQIRSLCARVPWILLCYALQRKPTGHLRIKGREKGLHPLM